MKKNNKITPEGTKDLLFEECLTRQFVLNNINNIFLAHGYHEVVTPAIEYYDVFNPDVSGICQEVMYKTIDKQGKLIVMRPDSTLPIARLTATRLQKLPKPIRLYYTQQIYRCNPGLTGRSDEIMQTGIEMLGSSGKRSDLEVIVTAIDALSKCVPDFRFEIGHAGFFKLLADQLKVSDDVREEIRQSIESKNYAHLNSILDNLPDSLAVRSMRRLPHLFGGEEIFTQALPICLNDDLCAILNYLKELYSALSELKLKNTVMIDLGLVQRNDYYSDVIFSAYVEELGDAVLAGGRYDNLLSLFDSPMPAIGFAIHVDALTRVLLERGEKEAVRTANILIHAENGYEIKSLQYASKLIAQGFCCENSVFETREDAINYATINGIKRIDFVGKTVSTLMV